MFFIGIREIYNEYLISLINANELSSAFDLYQHSFGQKKNIFTVKPAILRGLVVAFFNAGKCEFARSVFMHGIFTDVYPIKKVYCYYLLFRVLFIFI